MAVETSTDGRPLYARLQVVRGFQACESKLCAAGRFPMKTVTDTLGLARSNIAERTKGVRPKRGPQTRDGDPEFLGICALLAHRIHDVSSQRSACVD
jgi:hypothetical protein